MDLTQIIDEVASRADDILAGMRSRNEARVGIFELLNGDYPKLSPAERKKAADAVMAILEREGFFETSGRWSGTGDEIEGA